MRDTPEMCACCDCEFDGVDACLLSDIRKIGVSSSSKGRGMLLSGLIHHFAIYGLVEYEAYPCRYPDRPLCVVWPTEKLLNNPIVPLRYKSGRDSMLETIAMLEGENERLRAEKRLLAELHAGEEGDEYFLSAPHLDEPAERHMVDSFEESVLSHLEWSEKEAARRAVADAGSEAKA